MGTRNLTVVYVNGEHKVAQYCQWDGYPSGQGKTVLDFLRTAPLDQFKAAIENCSWVSEADMKARWEAAGADGSGWASFEVSEQFQRLNPQLHRSTGAGVLQMILTRGGMELNDAIDFAADGLFCEWAYVIDLDANMFEVYSGFRTEGCEGRFASMYEPGEEYQPVSLIASYPLENLPASEEFLELENEPA